MNPQHYEVGKVLRLESLHDMSPKSLHDKSPKSLHDKSHTIPVAQKRMQMTRNMVSLLVVRKNYENVSGVRVRIGTWYGRKVYRQEHMGRQMIGGAGSGSDIHHRETDKKCKKPYERLLLRQLDKRSCP